MPREAAVQPLIEPIDEIFGLSYASYLVLRRVVLQSMPVDWQARFLACMKELEDAVLQSEVRDWPDACRVTYVDHRGRFIRDPAPHYRRAPNVLRPRR